MLGTRRNSIPLQTKIVEKEVDKMRSGNLDNSTWWAFLFFWKFRLLSENVLDRIFYFVKVLKSPQKLLNVPNTSIMPLLNKLWLLVNVLISPVYVFSIHKVWRQKTILLISVGSCHLLSNGFCALTTTVQLKKTAKILLTTE